MLHFLRIRIIGFLVLVTARTLERTEGPADLAACASEAREKRLDVGHEPKADQYKCCEEYERSSEPEELAHLRSRYCTERTSRPCARARIRVYRTEEGERGEKHEYETET